MSLPDITEADVLAVADVVRSGRIALGPKAQEFEKKVADYVGTRYAVSVSSGTSGLHLIVRALNLKEGDEVLVPSFTFAASVNALLFERLKPVFVDIESETYCLDIRDCKKKLSPRVKALMVVDVFGHPANWDEILNFADRHGLRIIDDSCEALGAEYRGRKLGSFGDAAAFAFYPNKQITTGEGGMIVTNREDIAKLCFSLRNQGRGEMGSWLEHENLGYNYRLDDMSAALGLSQMNRIDEILAKRDRVASWYTKKLSGFSSLQTPRVRSDVKMSWFVYVVRLDPRINRTNLIERLEKMGIPSRAYFSPIHKQVYIQKIFGSSELKLPITDEISDSTLALPFYSNMTETEVDRVVSTLRQLC
jgi:perosamine synthetase